MADPRGTFAPELLPEGWFDETLRPEGWFSQDLLESSTGGSPSEVTGTVTATLTSLQFTSTGLHGVSGAVSGTLLPLTFSVQGSQVHIGDLTSVLLPLSFGVSGVTGYTGEVSATLAPLSFEATGETLVPITGVVATRLAPLVFTASGNRGSTGTVSIVLPALRASLTETEEYDTNSMGTLNGKNHWYKTWRNNDGLLVSLGTRPWLNPFKRIGLKDNEVTFDFSDRVLTTTLDTDTGPTLSSNGRLRLFFGDSTVLVNADGSVSATLTTEDEEDIGLYTSGKKLRVILDTTPGKEIDPFHKNGALRISNTGYPTIDFAFILESGDYYFSEASELLLSEESSDP